MTARELIKKYLTFFESKNHKTIPGASLIPENDSSALFISAGMHPLVPFLMGEKHPAGNRLANVQKCLRTDDIEYVGDGFHHTFFLMLGNWSLGDPASPDGIGQGGYFKEGAISMSFEFLTFPKWLRIDPQKLYVSVFKGDNDIPRDEESIKIWQQEFSKVGIVAKVGERIFPFPKKENWWGPVGKTGPCGPDTEMFFDTGKKKCNPNCDPSCQCGKYIEIWNNVFMEYNKTATGNYEPLKQKNVDTGMGVTRVVAVLNGFGDDDYKTELFKPIIKKIEAISNKPYRDEKNKKPMRIIADHIRAATFIISDGISPSNVERGYILRRLIRRAIRHGHLLGIKNEFLGELSSTVINEYKDLYPELEGSKEKIEQELEQEEELFSKTLRRGLKELEKITSINQFIRGKDEKKILSGETTFKLYDTYGFPLELTEELAREKGFIVDSEGFKSAFKEHQKRSRAGVEKKFAGGLANQSKTVVCLHTATHLLHQALRDVLGNHVQQKGSNITPERLRFDFSHNKKLSELEIKRINELVNQKIKENLPVTMEIMSLEEAKKEGVLAFFGEKYGEKVKVYSIGPSSRSAGSPRLHSGQAGQAYSKEVCGGPHARKTVELGHFKIIKQESVGKGIRRIKAVLG